MALEFLSGFSKQNQYINSARSNNLVTRRDANDRSQVKSSPELDSREKLFKFLSGFTLDKTTQRVINKKENLRSPSEKKLIQQLDAIQSRAYQLDSLRVGDIPHASRHKAPAHLTLAYPSKVAEAIVPIYRGVKFSEEQVTPGTTFKYIKDTQQPHHAIVHSQGHNFCTFEHNIGRTGFSAYTSWTTDLVTAHQFSGSDGHILVAHIRNGDVISSPGATEEDEAEVLLPNKVIATEVRKPISPEDPSCDQRIKSAYQQHEVYQEEQKKLKEKNENFLNHLYWHGGEY